MTTRSRRARLVAVAGVLTVPLAASGAAPALAAPGDDERSAALQEAVTTEGVLEHLAALQRIADENGGNRAGGTPGYDASVDYVTGLLEEAGYEVSTQEFEFPFFEETAPAVLERVDPSPAAYPATDFLSLSLSGSGDVTAPVVPVDVEFPPTVEAGATDSGCEEADFAGFPAGSIALVQRGLCTFEVKVANATAAGASAVIVANEGQEGRTDAVAGTLETPSTIPAVGTTSAVGAELAATPTTVRVATATVNEVRSTRNVIADSPEGDDENVVVVGAHLDSVPEGPGVNDNGTGSAAILEVALQLAAQEDGPENSVRFAWWGAEELGLVGSTEYVASLTPEELVDVALYLNFDMVGSPNYAQFVYDGDGSSFELVGPAGSQQIEQLFNDHFTGEGLPFQATTFDGRSDYEAFILNGIPAGGLFTGAEGVKTEEEAALYGGVAGAAYDPCYHLACDTLTDGAEGRDPAVYGALEGLVGNVSTEALDANSDAIAHAVATYADDTSDVNGVVAREPAAAGAGGGLAAAGAATS